MTETLRYAARVFAPVFYAAAFVVVCVAVWSVFGIVERVAWLDGPGVWRPYHAFIVAAAMIVLVGGTVFWLLGRTLVWMEQLRAPSAVDHLRHCILLYVVLLPATLLGALYLWSYLRYGGTVGAWIFVALGFVVAGYGVLIDAMILRRQRFRRANLGGAR